MLDAKPSQVLSVMNKSLSYLDTGSLDVFELIIVLREGHVRYLPWDKYQNSIRVLHGDLFLIEHNAGWFLAFLCASQLEDHQLSKRLYDLVSAVAAGSQACEEEFPQPSQCCFDVSSVALVRMSTNVRMTSNGPILDVEEDGIEDDIMVTFKMESGATVALLFSKSNQGIQAVGRLWSALRTYLSFRRSDCDSRTFIVVRRVGSQQQGDTCFQHFGLSDLEQKSKEHFFSRMLKAPQAAVLDELLKMTKFVRDTFGREERRQYDVPEGRGQRGTRRFNFALDRQEMAEFVRSQLAASAGRLKQDEVNDLLAADPTMAQVRSLACKRGLSPEARLVVWNHFAGCCPLDASEESKEWLGSETSGTYEAVKRQWQSMLPEQVDQNSVFKARQDQIRKDVHRIPSECLGGEGDREQWAEVCENVLMSYAVYNNDVGYSQALADLLTVVIYVHKQGTGGKGVDEAALFASLNAIIKSFFPRRFNEQEDHIEILRHLNLLGKLISFADPRMAEYFERNNSLNMFVCFRWLVVWFIRELPLPAVVRLWDALMSGYPCKANFDLLVCFALLQFKRGDLLSDNRDFDGTLGFINNLTGQMNAEENEFSEYVDRIILMAVNTHDQLTRCSDLPDYLRDAFRPASDPTTTI